MTSNWSNLKRFYAIRFDSAYKAWVEGDVETSTIICYELLVDPATPKAYRAWSNLMLATTDTIPDADALVHAELAEQEHRAMHEQFPNNPHHKRTSEYALEVLNNLKFDLQEEKEAKIKIETNSKMEAKAKENVASPRTGTIGRKNVAEQLKNSTYRIDRPMEAFDMFREEDTGTGQLLSRRTNASNTQHRNSPIVLPDRSVRQKTSSSLTPGQPVASQPGWMDIFDDPAMSALHNIPRANRDENKRGIGENDENVSSTQRGKKSKKGKGTTRK